MLIPKVSIIIPNYNNEKYIEQCIKSCIFQEYKNLEIIIIDDGSNDNSEKIISKYYKNFDFIKFFKTTNKGANHARNLGIFHATGKYIQFLDSDDLLSANKISSQIQILEEKYHPLNISYVNYCTFKDEISDAFFLNNTKGESFVNGLDFIVNVLGNKWLQTSCWLISKEMCNLIGNWDVNLIRNQDGDYFSRVLLNSNKGFFSKNGNVYYRINSNGISNKKVDKNILESMYWSQDYLYQYILNNGSYIHKKYIAKRIYDLVLPLRIYNSQLVNLIEENISNLNLSPSDYKNLFIEVFKKIFGFKITYRFIQIKRYLFK